MANAPKLPLGGFKWAEERSQINTDFIKSFDNNCDIGYLFEVDVQYPENLITIIMIYLFFLKEWQLEKLKNL